MKKMTAILLGSILGAVVVGFASYSIYYYAAMRPQGLGGGMAGMGRELDSWLVGGIGAIVGLIGGGIVAHLLHRRRDKSTQS